jgi:hypothetical protein
MQQLQTKQPACSGQEKAGIRFDTLFFNTIFLGSLWHGILGYQRREGRTN